MKSLNFQKLSLRKEDFLSKTQMKNILGGYGGGGGCLGEFEYACSLSANPDPAQACCPSYTCKMNATNSGTICV